jgi:hypothetical protein
VFRAVLVKTFFDCDNSMGEISGSIASADDSTRKCNEESRSTSIASNGDSHPDVSLEDGEENAKAGMFATVLSGA